MENDGIERFWTSLMDEIPSHGLARRSVLKTTLGAAFGLVCGLPLLGSDSLRADATSGIVPLDQKRRPHNANTKSYYLSSSEGRDHNNGTSGKPWKSLAKISAVLLRPGDAVYFKKGDRFDGHFVINGSGSEEQPIVISSYGDGPKPVLTGEVGAAEGGDYHEAIYINNHDNIVLDGLEVHNERKISRANVADVDACGIRIHNSGTKVMKNFTLRNMSFRNVYAVRPMNSQKDFDHLQVAAVSFDSEANTRPGEEKNIQNVLVEGCYFTAIQRLGVHFKHGGGKYGVGNDSINRNMNIVVRNNEFHYLGGTCVLPTFTYNCLIENNLFDHPGASVDPRMPGRGSSVWPFRAINTVIQHNECLSTRGYEDSMGLHIDIGNVNTFIQYNYMEDCEGGFVEILGENENAVYRFNISVNDGWRRLSQGAYKVAEGDTIRISEYSGKDKVRIPSENSYVYNNTIYLDKEFSTAINIDGKDISIYNNIFYSSKGGEMGGQKVSVNDNGTPFYMSNNLFYGAIEKKFEEMDQNPIKGDPRFAAGASGLNRFQLSADSPAINRGAIKRGPAIPGAGTGIFKDVPPYPTVDFYGNPVDLSNGALNIGACNSKNGNTVPGGWTFRISSRQR